MSSRFILVIQITNINLFPKQAIYLFTFQMKDVCPLFLIPGVWKKKKKLMAEKQTNKKHQWTGLILKKKHEL